MLVNPQVFNFRLTLGTLIVAFVAFAGYSYSSYSDVRAEEVFLKQEKKLLVSQVSEMISHYDQLDGEAEALISELKNANSKIERTQDSLSILKAKMFLINKDRTELMHLRDQKLSLLKKEDSFSIAKQDFIEEKTAISKHLDQQIAYSSKLEEENKSLEETLKKGALITANSFDAAAYGIKDTGEITVLNKAEDSKNIRVAFVIAKNALALQEEKDLYIQVIGPDNNVVANKGFIEFNDATLIYSSKLKVNYNKDVLEICTNIKSETPLKQGTYYISVFENERRLGGTKIMLN